MSERRKERRSRKPSTPWWRRHQRAAPRLDPAWKTDNLMNEGVKAARRVYEDRDRAFPELLKRRRGRGSKVKGTAPVIYTVTRKRSDRSEAHARAHAFFVGHCDLRTMRVGAYRKGGTIAFYDLERMAQGIGISPWQLDRVISDFKACGWIHRHQSRELVEDPTGDRMPRFRGRIGTLKLTLAALQAVGLTEDWRDSILEREHKEREQQARQRREASTPSRVVISPAADVALIGAAIYDDVPEADAPRYNALCFQVNRDHPDWPDEQVRAEARRRLGVPDPPDRR